MQCAALATHEVTSDSIYAHIHTLTHADHTMQPPLYASCHSDTQHSSRSAETQTNGVQGLGTTATCAVPIQNAAHSNAAQSSAAQSVSAQGGGVSTQECVGTQPQEEWLSQLRPCGRALLGREAVSSTGDVMVLENGTGVFVVYLCLCFCSNLYT